MQIWFKFIARTLYQIFTSPKHFFVADFNPILRTQVVGGFINHINIKFHTTRHNQLILNTLTVSFFPLIFHYVNHTTNKTHYYSLVSTVTIVTLATQVVIKVRGAPDSDFSNAPQHKI
jgi:hypothetical protein